MKTNMRKIAIAATALILLTGCSSTQKQLPQIEETTSPATVTVLQRNVLPEWTPDAGRTENLTGQPDSESIETDSGKTEPALESAKDEVGDADATPDESTAESRWESSVQSAIVQEETPVAQEQPAETSPQTETQPPAEERPTTVEQSEPTPQPAPAEQPEPTPQSALEDPLAPAPDYGAIPFSLADGTGKWWHIDTTDSAYWAVAEQINTMRAAGGLEALIMDETLSATASSRCESFVAGGPFDHSGMVTRSEICASGGPLGSAATVCAAWQASEVHYANIMEPSFTCMGVSCWFCADSPMQMTYWVVTFE